MARLFSRPKFALNIRPCGSFRKTFLKQFHQPIDSSAPASGVPGFPKRHILHAIHATIPACLRKFCRHPEYRFLNLNNATVGAQTNSATSVFVNSAGPYMTLWFAKMPSDPKTLRTSNIPGEEKLRARGVSTTMLHFTKAVRMEFLRTTINVLLSPELHHCVPDSFFTEVACDAILPQFAHPQIAPRPCRG